MSTETAREFFRHVAIDENLQARIRDEVGSLGQAGIFVLIRIAAESGFGFSADDFAAAIREISSERSIDPVELLEYGPDRGPGN